jgi:hypothetical protein
MLSIGLESISRTTLKSVDKHVNRPETFAALVEKIHSYGIMVFGFDLSSVSATRSRQSHRGNATREFHYLVVRKNTEPMTNARIAGCRWEN